MKTRLVSGDEFDAMSKWGRRYLSWQSGELAKIKRRVNKRERRDGKAEIQSQLDNDVEFPIDCYEEF